LFIVEILVIFVFSVLASGRL